MATNWNLIPKRSVGTLGTLYNTAGKTYNQPNTMYNGLELPTTWTFINKTS